MLVGFDVWGPVRASGYRESGSDDLTVVKKAKIVWSNSALMVVHFMETVRPAALYKLKIRAFFEISIYGDFHGYLPRKHQILLPG